jgi:hypothetical protein
MNMITYRPTQQVTPQPEIPVRVEPNSKTILWGAPFWFFFHTMAEKVKPDKFAQIRNEMFDIIREVCNNLPCPSCTQHAVSYISKINFQRIRTKGELITMLFEFHNTVNKNTRAPLFTYAELANKYSKANLINIVNYFMHFYKMEHHVIRMMADDMYRKRSAKKILDWFHANQQHFDI